ncbi:MAG: hypothetical protein SGJ19_05055 [Planctomycetia bacterium]|nr:hypothetical protein [Planctomycetia bacterium]
MTRLIRCTHKSLSLMLRQLTAAMLVACCLAGCTDNRSNPPPVTVPTDEINISPPISHLSLDELTARQVEAVTACRMLLKPVFAAEGRTALALTTVAMRGSANGDFTTRVVWEGTGFVDGHPFYSQFWHDMRVNDCGRPDWGLAYLEVEGQLSSEYIMPLVPLRGD